MWISRDKSGPYKNKAVLWTEEPKENFDCSFLPGRVQAIEMFDVNDLSFSLDPGTKKEVMFMPVPEDGRVKVSQHV